MERGHIINRQVSLLQRQFWAVNPKWKGKLWQIVRTSIVYGHKHGLAFTPPLLSHAGCLQLGTHLVLFLGQKETWAICIMNSGYQRQYRYSQYFLLGSLRQFIASMLLLDWSFVLGTLKYHGLAPLLTSITAKIRDSAKPCSKAKSREISLIPRLLFGPTAITVKLGW